jgi:hypothetical protein
MDTQSSTAIHSSSKSMHSQRKQLKLNLEATTSVKSTFVWFDMIKALDCFGTANFAST